MRHMLRGSGSGQSISLESEEMKQGEREERKRQGHDRVAAQANRAGDLGRK